MCLCNLLLMKGDDMGEPHALKSEGPNKELPFGLETVNDEKFDPQNPSQVFFRENTIMKPGMLVSRLGWKVADLTPDQ